MPDGIDFTLEAVMKLAFDKFKMCTSWNSANASQFQNEAAFDEVFQQANFNTFVFRSRVKLETYNVSKAAMVIKLTKGLQVQCHGIGPYCTNNIKNIPVLKTGRKKCCSHLGDGGWGACKHTLCAFWVFPITNKAIQLSFWLTKPFQKYHDGS